MAGKVEVKLTKSPIGSQKRLITVVRTLGLRRMQSTNILPDNPATWGQIKKVRHLVTARRMSENNGGS